MPDPVKWMLWAGVAAIASGTLALARAIAVYLDGGEAISSTSGLPVFETPEGFASYRPLTLSIEPTIIGIGVALVVAALLAAALVWRPRASR